MHGLGDVMRGLKHAEEHRAAVSARIKEAESSIMAAISSGIPMAIVDLVLVVSEKRVRDTTTSNQYFEDRIIAVRDSEVLPILTSAIRNDSLKVLDATGKINQKGATEATNRIPDGSIVSLLDFGQWHKKARFLHVPAWLDEALDASEAKSLSGITKKNDSLLIIAAALAKDLNIEIGMRGSWARIAEAADRYGVPIC